MTLLLQALVRTAAALELRIGHNGALQWARNRLGDAYFVAVSGGDVYGDAAEVSTSRAMSAEKYWCVGPDAYAR